LRRRTSTRGRLDQQTRRRPTETVSFSFLYRERKHIDVSASKGFKTDIDISQKVGGVRERPLQAWADDIPENTTASGRSGFTHSDDLTFGPGAASGGNQWDQFAANEKLFGVKAGFDEDAYTTKIDRNAPDFKEKEKKAQALANEIMSVSALVR
jgi:PAB1-binding protein PBP1